jgi:hypothetical protein
MDPAHEVSALDAFCSARGIHDRDRAILRAIDGFAHGAKATCFPSNATIARKAGLSVGHTRRRVAWLVGRGDLVRYRVAENRTGREFFLPWKAGPATDGGGQRTNDHDDDPGEGGPSS